jgi:hypothetical protein
MKAPAYFNVPKDLCDALLYSRMSSAEQKIALFVLRRSEGHYGRTKAQISLGIFTDRLPFSERHIQNALKTLVDNRVLFKISDADWGHGAEYALNHEYWNWGKFSVSPDALLSFEERRQLLRQRIPSSEWHDDEPRKGVNCTSPTKESPTSRGGGIPIKEVSRLSTAKDMSVSEDGRDGISVGNDGRNAACNAQAATRSGGAIPASPPLYTNRQIGAFLRDLSLLAKKCGRELPKREKEVFFADARRMLQAGEDRMHVLEAGYMLISQGLHLDMMSWAIKQVKYLHKDDRPGVYAW